MVVKNSAGQTCLVAAPLAGANGAILPPDNKQNPAW